MQGLTSTIYEIPGAFMRRFFILTLVLVNCLKRIRKSIAWLRRGEEIEVLIVNYR